VAGWPSNPRWPLIGARQRELVYGKRWAAEGQEYKTQ
jgi:hypothetical protein